MMKAIVFSALLVNAAAVSSGAALQAQSELAQIRTQVMAQAKDIFKINAIREGVKGVRSPKASSLLQGKSTSQWEDLTKYQDSGAAVASGVDLNLFQEHHANKFTKEAFESRLQELTEATDGSRYIGHEGNRKAMQYIMAHCEKNGFKVKEHKFQYNLPHVAMNLRQKNLINSMLDQNGNVACYKEGTDPTLKGETIVVGAHYDSVNWKDTTKNAPGMDDNGSGTSALLMIAHALHQFESKRSILLVAFNGEEEGLLGSKAFVPEVIASKEYGQLKYALIADEIAFPGRKEKGFTRKAIFETHEKVPGYKTLVDTAASTVAEDKTGTIAGFEVNKHGFGSDHMSFIDNDIPAMLLIERDDEWRADTRGHSSEDTTSDLDMDFGAAMTRLLFRTAVKLANPK